MLRADVYEIWICLTGLAALGLLLARRTKHPVAEQASEQAPVDLQGQLSARIFKLERLIADSQQQLNRTQQMISDLDKAA